MMIKFPGHRLLCLFLYAVLPGQVAAASAAADSDSSKIIVLNPADLSQWSEKIFDGQTRYVSTLSNTQSEAGTQTVIKAQSQASASGLFREIRIDLHKTPYLNWSWKIENTLDNVDETTKQGDDYPARIYVVVSGGLLFWKTRALNYVWSTRQTVNSHWPNAFTANAHMLAVNSGTSQLNVWVQQRRNVLQDLSTYLQLDSHTIDAIAIMTDTDNSGQKATAYYGPIYFSSQ